MHVCSSPFALHVPPILKVNICDIEGANKYFGDMVELKCVGKTLTDRNCMSEGMKRQVKLRERYRMLCVLVAVLEDWTVPNVVFSGGCTRR
jgi:hypothetical protein